MKEILKSFSEQIDAAINNSPHLPRPRRLKCVIHEGRVVLRGVVHSYFQKQMAQEAVRHVEGVHAIENELEVSSHSY